jgi:hypothetical protein
MRRLLPLLLALGLAGCGATATTHLAPSASNQAAQTTTTTSTSSAAPQRLLSYPQGLVNGAQAVVLHFAKPISRSVRPILTPTVAGHWSRSSATTLTFTPMIGWAPSTAISLELPAALVGHGRTLHWTTAVASSQRLTQLLADLGYLPVHFVSHADPQLRDDQRQLQAVYQPPQGHFIVGSSWPEALQRLWRNDPELIVKGAIMHFEAEHGLVIDGIAGPQVWKALLADADQGLHNAQGYTYALGSEHAPESLTVYHNGHIVVHTPANTGISLSPTTLGNFLVYERLQSQVMQGTDPDGEHYADPVQWVAYFHEGEAVHYIARASYGYRQSLGCIELPYAAAEQAWGYLYYGTPVSVTTAAP